MSDELPERPRKGLTILPLDGLSVAELESYISDLRTEIARAERMIERKKQHLGAADAVFGKPRGAE